MEIRSIAEIEASDHVLGLDWSHDGSLLAVTPASGDILLLDADGRCLASLPDHGISNSVATFHPKEARLATCGTDGKLRIYEPIRDHAPEKEISVGKGWLETLEWSPDGFHLATALSRRLIVLDANGDPAHEFAEHKSSISDLAWNPKNPREIAAVCDGGATMWRLGEGEPFARFDWGGASLLVEWSADGRWLATGDQTPSVHLYDFTRDYPLHIQGYETKVKALAFNSASRSLATGGGRLVTVWPCTGKRGPEGAIPKQLPGHDADCIALAWRRGCDILASGGADGMLILFEPASSARPRAQYDAGAEVAAIAWHPSAPRLAIGNGDGMVVVLEIPDLAK